MPNTALIQKQETSVRETAFTRETAFKSGRG